MFVPIRFPVSFHTLTRHIKYVHRVKNVFPIKLKYRIETKQGVGITVKIKLINAATLRFAFGKHREIVIKFHGVMDVLQHQFANTCENARKNTSTRNSA